MARPASRRGLLFGAASTALLTAAGPWLALGSLITSCGEQVQQAPGGTITTSGGCAEGLSRYESDGLAGVLWLGLPVTDRRSGPRARVGPGRMGTLAAW